MKIVLQYREWIVVELDEPFCYFYPRKASYVAFNANADSELFKEKNNLIPRVMWRKSLVGFPRYYHQVNIEQQDFPENVLKILKVLGILNNDDTVNSRYDRDD